MMGVLPTNPALQIQITFEILLYPPHDLFISVQLPLPCLLKANHFFRTGITTMGPVLIMSLLVFRAKSVERKARRTVGEELRKLREKAASLYEWTLVVRAVSYSLRALTRLSSHSSALPQYTPLSP